MRLLGTVHLRGRRNLWTVMIDEFPSGRILHIEHRLQPITFVKPKCPETARQQRIHGHVEVATLLNEDGMVVWASGKGDPALVGAAEAAARQCRFPKYSGARKPWITGRTPVVLTYTFELDDAGRSSRR